MSDAALPFVRAADLDDDDEQSRWLVDGLWARSGVGILGGAPKACKSWLGLDIALSVASATPCLGALPVADPGPVLVYMAEDAAAIVKSRLRGICKSRGLDLAALPIHVIVVPVLRLDLDKDQRRLVETVRRLRPRLLVLDPFVRLHRIDENNAGEVSALLAYLRALQRKHDVAVLVVHHARKNGPAGVQAGQRLRGSGDLHAFGDSNLYLRRVRDELVLTVEHRAARPPEPLTLVLAGGEHDAHLEIRGNAPVLAAPAAPTRDIGTELLAVLDAATEPVSRSALRSILRIRNERLGTLLADLVRTGRVVRNGPSWARVPVPAVPTSIERGAERNAELHTSTNGSHLP